MSIIYLFSGLKLVNRCFFALVLRNTAGLGGVCNRLRMPVQTLESGDADA